MAESYDGRSRTAASTVTESDIEILGMSIHHVAGDPPRQRCRHQFRVPISIAAGQIELALAIMSCRMSLKGDYADHTATIDTDEARMTPTVYNARRRLVVAINEAGRLLTEVRAAKPRLECRPIAIEPLPIERGAEQEGRRVTCVSDGNCRRSRRDDVAYAECGGVRYSFPEDSPGSVVFDRAQDGWRRMHNWTSTSESAPVLVLLMSARLNQRCRVEELGGWGGRGGLIDVSDRASAIDAIDAGNIAEQLWKAADDRLSSAIGSLPWEGQDSLFEEAFSDARDTLLGRLAAGAALDGQWLGHDEVAATIDGAPVEPVAALRLLQRRIELLEFEQNLPRGQFRARLKPGVKLDDRTLHPRKFTVSFRAFEEHCEHRQHWSEHECLHRNGTPDRCGVASCPRVSAVYHQEATYGSGDPHFNQYGDDWDTQVVANHRNTERSFAWRAAGEARVAVIVNIAAEAWSMGANYLVARGEEPAAREAVVLGHLEVIEETALGPIVRLASKHREALERHNGRLETA